MCQASVLRNNLTLPNEFWLFFGKHLYHFLCIYVSWSFVCSILKLMELEGVVSLDCCRLVKYDEFHEYLERSYEGEEDTPMGLLLGGVKSSYMFDLLLETRRPEQVFQPYKPGGWYPAAVGQTS